MRQYMRMVMEMLSFIRAVRTGDWKLHLKALELFTKYVFAHDRLNYACMILLYLAEMASLETGDPEICAEFLHANWVVNKNSNVPFCALGGDHGLEHINRSMKVTGGLVGISLNPSARTKFISHRSRAINTCRSSQGCGGVSSTTLKQHHNLTAAVLSREEKNIEKLLATINSFTDPFSEQGTELFNLVTKVVMSEEIKEDPCNQSEIGQNLLETFVQERINVGKVNFWSPMKKRKLLTWTTKAKVLKVSTKEKVVELRKDRIQDHCLQLMVRCCTVHPKVPR